MAHWVAVLESEHRSFTGKTKQEVINQLAIALTKKSVGLSLTIERQLIQARESVAVAYDSKSEQVAKVFVCNCGSVKKHLEQR